ncbi:hypothetical protein BJ508DRAFT_364959 [Ascobolus immersus RN42]|uniref:Uncharacterized protein n=1 Tax=Ascobolus immersus RN42 TaxID=1160509 RepID=A0A3N4HXC1_ASCIM|nr:hypothetical protein BJ508DRAFT_364959 [Ascobolus immersus RN42]
MDSTRDVIITSPSSNISFQLLFSSDSTKRQLRTVTEFRGAKPTTYLLAPATSQTQSSEELLRFQLLPVPKTPIESVSDDVYGFGFKIIVDGKDRGCITLEISSDDSSGTLKRKWTAPVPNSRLARNGLEFWAGAREPEEGSIKVVLFDLDEDGAQLDVDEGSLASVEVRYMADAVQGKSEEASMDPEADLYPQQPGSLESSIASLDFHIESEIDDAHRQSGGALDDSSLGRFTDDHCQRQREDTEDCFDESDDDFLGMGLFEDEGVEDGVDAQESFFGDFASAQPPKTGLDEFETEFDAPHWKESGHGSGMRNRAPHGARETQSTLSESTWKHVSKPPGPLRLQMPIPQPLQIQAITTQRGSSPLEEYSQLLLEEIIAVTPFDLRGLIFSRRSRRLLMRDVQETIAEAAQEAGEKAAICLKKAAHSVVGVRTLPHVIACAKQWQLPEECEEAEDIVWPENDDRLEASDSDEEFEVIDTDEILQLEEMYEEAELL